MEVLKLFGAMCVVALAAAICGWILLSLHWPKVRWQRRIMIAVLIGGTPGYLLWELSTSLRVGTLESPEYRCWRNLNEIARGLFAYRNDSEGFFPFDERGPLYSLSLLYPKYMTSDEARRVFICPAFNAYGLKGVKRAMFPTDTAFAGLPCDYGYQWHIPLNADTDAVIMAEMFANHLNTVPYGDGERGFNVLYKSSEVRLETTRYCAHDPHDNIFAPEPGWSADTDTYIRQTK